METKVFSNKFTKNYKILSFIALLVLLLCSCMFARPTPDVQATVAAALAATQTAQPTPTATSTPTPTRRPTSTPTRRPTNTPTRKPTSTPTLTPTPRSQPTATEAAQAGQIVTSTLQSGWTAYELVDEGFSIALPPEWLVIPLDAEALEKGLEAVAKENPALGRMLGENMRNLAAAGVKFYALNINPKTLTYDVPMTLNIIQVDLGIKLPLDSYVPIVIKQLENLLGSDASITHRRVTISGLEAEEFKYLMAMKNAAGNPIKGQVLQYIIPVGTMQYTITLVCPEELFKDYTATLEQIGASFKLSQ